MRAPESGGVAGYGPGRMRQVVSYGLLREIV